ncbi:MAG: pentapeptide repeat-containing protein [Prochlorothrix sp.]|nr:pentapeptide repeat-containing protein [Prochlorothrix sp.]
MPPSPDRPTSDPSPNPALPPTPNNGPDRPPSRPLALTPLVLLSSLLTLIGMASHFAPLGIVGAWVTGLLGLRLLWPELRTIAQELLIDQWGAPFIGLLGLGIATAAVIEFTGWGDETIALLGRIDWEIVGALGSVLGAAGQILIAVLAVYIAWRQYVISKDLTIQQNLLTVQQNLITQQQTIDSYFQGVSDLVLDDEGLLEDWPQERAIAEARTAAILSSIDAAGRAKVIRFLSSAKLLTPLKRDQHLGRAILDGRGGYAEDRLQGLRVIDLGVMLAKSDLSGTDLRWTDLSEVNLVGANLAGCDLVRANLSRTILYEASLQGADLLGVRLFYGSVDMASPRSRTEVPDYETGAYTGAVVENADFTGVVRMSEEQRRYCCAWGGEKTRGTVPGGCGDVESCLDREGE